MHADSLSPRPTAWPALAAYVVGFAFTLASSVAVVSAVAMVRAAHRGSSFAAEAQGFALSTPGLLYGALVSAAALATVALVAARLEGKPVVARLGLGPSRATPLGVLAATAGLLGLNMACATTGEMLGARGSGVMEAMALALQSPTPARFVAAMLTLGVAPAVAEEMFFRGLIQTRLIASWGRWLGIVAAAAAFGLIHMDPLQGSIAFAAGLYLGWTVDRFAGIRPSILAHAVNNSVVVTFGAFGSSGDGSRHAQAAVVAVGVAACIASIALLRRTLATDS